MKGGRRKGGAAIPAVIDTGRRKRSNMAQPVFKSTTGRVKGGAAQNIIEITSDNLVQNGGQYKLIGGAPIPMEMVAGRRSKQGAAQVVYPVDILGNYDPSFAGYIYKVLTSTDIYDASSLVGFWPQNELAGGVSFDHSGNDYHGAYTAVNLGQPGVPGMGMSSAGYDGATSFNNLYSAGLANDNGLANPGFETPGAMPPTWLNWVDDVGDGAIANEVVIVHEGTDAAKLTAGVLRNTLIDQNVVTVPGVRYRIRFWTRGDGANAGRYSLRDLTNGNDIIGTTNTGVPGAVYTMVVREWTAPAGCISVRVRLLCPNALGGICYYDACEVRRMNGFLGDQGTLLVWAQVANAGVWTDGTVRVIYQVFVGANNRFHAYRDVPNNRVAVRAVMGSVAKQVNIDGLTTLGFMRIGCTWDISAGATGEFRMYIDGTQSGATQVGLGTWVGDLSICVLGASSTVPAGVWSGNEGPSLLYNEAKTPAEMLYLSTV